MRALALLLAALATLPAAHGSADCLPFRVGNDFVLNAPPGSYVMRASYSGGRVVLHSPVGWQSSDPELSVWDLASGEKLWSRKAGEDNAHVTLSPDGSLVAMHSSMGGVEVVDLRSGASRRWPSESWGIQGSAISSDNRVLVTQSFGGHVSLRDLASGENHVFEIPGSYRDIQFSSSGQAALVTSSDEAVLVDLATWKETRFPLESTYYNSAFSPDGKRLLLIGEKGPALLDLPGGARHPISPTERPDYYPVLGFAKEGREAILVGNDGSVTRIEADGRVVHERGFPGTLPVLLSADGKSLYGVHPSGTLASLDLDTGQSPWTIPRAGAYFFPWDEPEGRLLGAAPGGPQISISLETICIPEESIARVECRRAEGPCAESAAQLPSRPGDWPTLDLGEQLPAGATPAHSGTLPTRPLTGAPMSAAEAKSALSRFALGFDSPKDLPVLIGILRAEGCDEIREAIPAALRGVLRASNALYQDLVVKFPFLTEIPAKGAASPEDSAEAAKFLELLLARNLPTSRFEDWDALRPLAPALAALPEGRKEEAIDQIAQSLADRAAQNEYREVFPSKLYKLAYQAVAPRFGEKQDPLTDLTLVRDGANLRAIALGVSSIGELSSSTRLGPVAAPKDLPPDYGFFASEIASISVPSTLAEGEMLADQETSWVMSGQRYHAKWSATGLGPATDFVPTGDGPDYASLWKDGVLRGILITNPSLGSDLSTYVIDEYLAYYQGEGFEFGEPEAVPSVREYLQAEVSSGRADYLIKEAHSDGDEKNLFRTSVAGQRIRGSRRLPDGKREEVDLVFPAPETTAHPQPSELLSNEAFGAWMRAREAAGKGQLVYFNTSCNSYGKALYEIPAAGTPLLLDIATEGLAQTFAFEPDNAELLMIEAFRDGKSYARIREAMAQNEEYRERKENVFLFPDEPGYREAITEKLETPLALEVRITDSDGKPYNIDQFSHP